MQCRNQGKRVQQVHAFKYPRCMMNDKGAEDVVCEKVMKWMRIVREIKVELNEMRLSLVCKSYL